MRGCGGGGLTLRVYNKGHFTIDINSRASSPCHPFCHLQRYSPFLICAHPTPHPPRYTHIFFLGNMLRQVSTTKSPKHSNQATRNNERPRAAQRGTSLSPVGAEPRSPFPAAPLPCPRASAPAPSPAWRSVQLLSSLLLPSPLSTGPVGGGCRPCCGTAAVEGGSGGGDSVYAGSGVCVLTSGSVAWGGGYRNKNKKNVFCATKRNKRNGGDFYYHTTVL